MFCIADEPSTAPLAVALAACPNLPDLIASGLKSDVKKQFDDLKAHSDARDAEILSRIEAAEKEIKYIERDFVTKTEHFKDTEGWRTEIQAVRGDVSRLPLEIIKLMKKE